MIKIIIEYVWLDSKQKFRTKVKIVDCKDNNLNEVAKKAVEWNFDGSSTGQSTGDDSEIIIRPFKILESPFMETNPKYYAFCECFNQDGTPAKGNTRRDAVEYFKRSEVKEADPMFGLEQEFYVFKDSKPLVWSNNPVPQGNYYCGVGYDSIKNGRVFLENLTNILMSNFNITGSNFEVGPGQMEIQLCEKGLKCADSLIMLRFFMESIAEQNYYTIVFTPKPEFLSGSEWSGSGCHVNFSTKLMRTRTKNDLSSLYLIARTIQNLNDTHLEDVNKLGSENNKLRLTGLNETSSIDNFTYGIANRNASVRIPRECVKNLEGYIEDRRPGSDMDPYVVLPLVCESGITKNANPEKIQEIMLKILKVHTQEYLKT